jgi:hypothetical protein
MTLLGISQGEATTYNIDIVDGESSLIGTISTDGTTGPLLASDITDWDLTVDAAGSGEGVLLGPDSGNNSALGSQDTQFALSATATSLNFNFEDTASSYFYFLAPSGTFAQLVDAYYSSPDGYVQLAAGGFGTSFSISDTQIGTVTPLPAALPLFATGLGVIGLLAWRQKRQRFA